MSNIHRIILTGDYRKVVSFPLVMFTEGLGSNTTFLLVLVDSLNNRFAQEKDFIFLWKKPGSSPFKGTGQLLPLHTSATHGREAGWARSAMSLQKKKAQVASCELKSKFKNVGFVCVAI